jgi:hypothetical protein
MMHVAVSHHVDESEPDSAGFHEYRYEYDIYRFTLEKKTYIARVYDDSPDRVAFLSCEENGRSRRLNAADFACPLLAEAVGFLEARGKTAVERLTDREGYRSLNLARPENSKGV